MSIITPDFLTRCGGNPAGAARYAASLAASCDKRGVTTPARITPMLANILNESSALTQVSEDCTYTSAAYLCQVFPSKFPTLASAQPYVRNSNALAAKVYGTADGVDLRGRGLPQLTGLANLTAYGKDRGMGVAAVAAYLTTPDGAADSAVWFYVQRGCLPLADRGDLLGVTKLWEGSGAIGWATVQKWHGQVLHALGAHPTATQTHAGSGTAAAILAPARVVSGQPGADALMDAELNQITGA